MFRTRLPVSGIATIPLDLHVLSLPLAFILSQDQTLHCKWIVQNWLMFSNVNFRKINRFNLIVFASPTSASIFIAASAGLTCSNELHRYMLLLFVFPNLSKNFWHRANLQIRKPAITRACCWYRGAWTACHASYVSIPLFTFKRTFCYRIVAVFSQTECKGMRLQPNYKIVLENNSGFFTQTHFPQQHFFKNFFHPFSKGRAKIVQLHYTSKSFEEILFAKRGSAR